MIQFEDDDRPYLFATLSLAIERDVAKVKKYLRSAPTRANINEAAHAVRDLKALAIVVRRIATLYGDDIRQKAELLATKVNEWAAEHPG